jgi:hypothetical protein
MLSKMQDLFGGFEIMMAPQPEPVRDKADIGRPIFALDPRFDGSSCNFNLQKYRTLCQICAIHYSKDAQTTTVLVSLSL